MCIARNHINLKIIAIKRNSGVLFQVRALCISFSLPAAPRDATEFIVNYSFWFALNDMKEVCGCTASASDTVSQEIHNPAFRSFPVNYYTAMKFFQTFSMTYSGNCLKLWRNYKNESSQRESYH